MSGEVKRRRKDDVEDYDSSFEDDDEEEVSGSRKDSRMDLTAKDFVQPGTSKSHTAGIPHKSYFDRELGKAESFMSSYLNLNAFERHRKLINEYLLYYPGAKKLLHRDSSKDKNDSDIIRENHRFVWEENDEADTWEKQLSKRYYDKLFKEYCICDLSLYKAGKIAMRWRTEKEVVDGKGQFVCGARKCLTGEELKTWEVNFAYMEESVKKNALVKLRLCPECSIKLNFNNKNKPKLVTKTKKKKKHRKPRSDSDATAAHPTEKIEESNDIQKVNDGGEQDETSGKGNIWKDPVQSADVKSREEEFDDYLDDLFM